MCCFWYRKPCLISRTGAVEHGLFEHTCTWHLCSGGELDYFWRQSMGGADTAVPVSPMRSSRGEDHGTSVLASLTDHIRTDRHNLPAGNKPSSCTTWDQLPSASTPSDSNGPANLSYVSLISDIRHTLYLSSSASAGPKIIWTFKSLNMHEYCQIWQHAGHMLLRLYVPNDTVSSESFGILWLLFCLYLEVDQCYPFSTRRLSIRTNPHHLSLP